MDDAWARAGLASRAALIGAGYTDHRITAAIETGSLRRIRRGWFAGRDADERTVAAVAAGGRLSCASALIRHGVWVLDGRALHVAVPHGSHARSTDLRRIHHGRLRAEATTGPVESALEALERMSFCVSPLETVIAADSALEHGLVTMSQLTSIFDRSRRARWLLEHVDGRSQSGTETIARLALRRRGIRLRSQVVIDGVGRVDLVLGDRLVLEIDGAAWHDTASQFESDRRRDLDLAVRGYLVVRVSYRRVLDDWAAVERDLLTLIRRDEHLWHAQHLSKNSDWLGCQSP